MGHNINPQTLLATDYLNHFNEVHMLIDMVADMPDFLKDISAWRPKTYQEHFQNSIFAEKGLAIEAYSYSPNEFRLPFEQIVCKMNTLVMETIARLECEIDPDNMERMQKTILHYTPKMIQFIEECSSIINGEKTITHQENIDHYFDDDEDKLDGEDLDQSAIDDLFG